MNDPTFRWRQGIDWKAVVAEVNEYLRRPNLVYGDNGNRKARPFIDALCSRGRGSRAQLKQELDLTSDGVATILSNGTMAQGENDVRSPEDGGWYATVGERETLTYIVCPGFADAWNARFSRS